MAARKPNPRVPELKQQAVSLLEDGPEEFALNVTGLSRRERNIVRMHVNRWLRNHGLRGETHYRDEMLELLTVRVLGPRDDR